MDKVTNEYLAELIVSFALNKSQASDLKVECDRQNNEIKKIMADEQISTFLTDEYNASYIVKEQIVVNEEQLTNVLIEDWIARHGLDSYKKGECPYIMMKPVVIQEALESAIYKGEFEDDTLAKIKACSSIKHTPTLTVKRKGKK